MSTTKNAAFGIKKFSNILFTFTIFFTSCCFFEHSKPPTFEKIRHLMLLKIILAVILPAAVAIFNYCVNKDLIYLADRTASIMTLYTFLYIIDTLKINSELDAQKANSSYHLMYGAETFFIVLAVIVVIAFVRQRDGQLNNGFRTAMKSFFCGSIPVFAFGFILIYFLLRSYGGNYQPVNLTPFKGEMSAFATQGEPILLLRDIGNVFYFTGLTMTLCELAKRFKFFWAVILPILLSVSMELYQYAFVCGDPDVDDVILNTFGIIVGFLIYKLIIEKLKENELCWELLEQWMWK